MIARRQEYADAIAQAMGVKSGWRLDADGINVRTKGGRVEMYATVVKRFDNQDEAYQHLIALAQGHDMADDLEAGA